MKLVFWLSAKNIQLAKEEVLALANPKSYELFDRVLVLDSRFSDFGRLAYTKRVYRHLFSCSPEELVEKIKKFDWKKVYCKDFCVRVRNFHLALFGEPYLAGLIWNRLKKPKVNLTSPSTQVEFLFVKRRVFCCLLLHKVDSSAFDVVAQLRPGFHPATLNPRFARALVNLSGVKKNQVLLDPFCGVGSILIEASSVGCKSIGSDVDGEMLAKAGKNLRYFKLKARLVNEDALKLKVRADAIVTDPPYGRLSYTTMDVSRLYKSFLSHTYPLLRKRSRLVIVFPNSFSFRSKFVLVSRIPFYVHKSLTRNIYVLEKR